MIEYVSPLKYAKKNGLSKQTVYRWIREGKLKAQKVERVVERLMVVADKSL